MTKFGSQTNTSQELVYEAATDALDDASMSMDQIDAIVVSTVDTENNGERQRLFTGILSSILKKKVPIINPTAVCGGGGTAMWAANKLSFDNVLVVGVERLLSNNTMRVTD